MARPTRDKLIAQIFETLTVAKRGMYMQYQAIARSHGVSGSQLEVLYAVQHTQPVYARQLAEQLQLTAGALSQIVDKLFRQGLIARLGLPADRRVQALRLSDSGALLLENIDNQRRSRMRAMMDELSDEELANWLRTQQKIISHFQTQQHKQQSNQEEQS